MKGFFTRIGMFSLCVAFATPALAISDEEAMREFTVADINSNNSLDRSEFEVFIQAMAKLGHTKAQRAVRFGLIGYGSAWRQADINKDNIVTLKELEKAR